MFNSISIDCSNIGVNELTFNYTDPLNPNTLTDFAIERSFDNVIFNVIGTVPYITDGAYSYDDTDLASICDIVAYYRVQPRDEFAANYDTVSLTVSCGKECTTIVPADPAAAPATNCASANSSSGIVVSWGTYPGASSSIPYLTTHVYKSVDGGTFGLLVSLSGAITSYTDTAVAPGSTYAYYIQYAFPPEYGTLSNVSATSAICSLADDCRQDGALTSFPYTVTVDTDCKMVIANLMDTNGNFTIPTSLSCYDIGSVTSMALKVYECYTDPNAVDFVNLDIAHPAWDSATESFIFSDYSEGVWMFTLQTVYQDLDGNEITITTTKCAYLNCCHKCSLAKEALTTSKDILDLFLIMEVVDTAVTCNDCYIACDMYKYLHKQINRYDCNC